MSITSNLNGSFSLAELRRMKWPFAWSGTVAQEDQVREESALRALASEAIAQLQAAYDHWELEEGQELEIRIVNGEIIEIVEV